jgi:ElaB/YqjD/DUF883 family membrane-anchored ribosome-binding protein
MSVTDLDEAGPDGPMSESAAAPPGAGAKARIQRASEGLRSRAKSYAQAGQRQASAAQARAMRTVREKPVAAVGSAAGAALVLGIALGFCLGQAFANRAAD